MGVGWHVAGECAAWPDLLAPARYGGKPMSTGLDPDDWRRDCCATWPKPCTYHEGMIDGWDLSVAHDYDEDHICRGCGEVVQSAPIPTEQATVTVPKAEWDALVAAVNWWPDRPLANVWPTVARARALVKAAQR